MTKHKRCSRCNGQKKILEAEYSGLKPKMIEVVCPVCRGTGYEEIYPDLKEDKNILDKWR